MERKTIEVKSKRSGHTYVMAELTSLQSADAFGFAGLPARAQHYRMALAIKSIDGVVTPPLASDLQVRNRLEKIPESDLDLLNYEYNKAFAITEQDLGNESVPEDSPESSSAS